MAWSLMPKGMRHKSQGRLIAPGIFLIAPRCLGFLTADCPVPVWKTTKQLLQIGDSNENTARENAERCFHPRNPLAGATFEVFRRNRVFTLRRGFSIWGQADKRRWYSFSHPGNRKRVPQKSISGWERIAGESETLFPIGKLMQRSRCISFPMGNQFGEARKPFPGWESGWAKPADAFPDGKWISESRFSYFRMGKGKPEARNHFPVRESVWEEPENAFPSGKRTFAHPKTKRRREKDLFLREKATTDRRTSGKSGKTLGLFSVGRDLIL